MAWNNCDSIADMQTSRYKKIAQIMCQVAHEELWLPRIDWARERVTDVNLVFRVGSGKSTYHRHVKGDCNHVITFGAKMVQDKFDPENARRWKTAREIQKRGYCDSLTLLNLLSHTIMHEFAHFMQVCLGRVYRGSIHNEAFYEILENAYRSGAAEKVRERLQFECEQAGLELVFHKSRQSSSEITAFKPGDIVFFKHKGKAISAIVEKINRETLTVRRKYSMAKFRVSPSLLNRTADRNET